MNEAKLIKGQHVYTSFGLSVEVKDYSESLHAATVVYPDGSEQWLAAETLSPAEEI